MPIEVRSPIEGNILGDVTCGILSAERNLENDYGAADTVQPYRNEALIDDGGIHELLVKHQSHEAKLPDLRLREAYEVHLRETEEGFDLRVLRAKMLVEELSLNIDIGEENTEENKCKT